jgi:hypothetical protein
VETTVTHNSNWPAWSPPEALRRILGRLPPVAKLKYNRLTAMSADCEALINSSIAKQTPLQVSFGDLEHRRQFLDPKTDAAELAALEAEMDAVRSELARLDRERSTRQASKQNTDQIIAGLREVFLLGGKLTWPVHAVHVEARPQDGEDLPSAILRTRAEIVVAHSELAAVRHASGTLEELGIQIVEEIERKAERGRPRVTVNANKLTISWPDVLSLAPKGSVLSAPMGSGSDMLCWLHQKEVAQKLFGDLLAQHQESGGTGISEEERGTRIKEIGARVMELEHTEENLIEQALAAGIECHRRTGASPWALLSIAPGAEVPVMEAAE